MSKERFWFLKDQGREIGSDKGVVSVEFALIVLSFLLLTLGLVDVGRGIWAYNSLTYAVREGARYAIVHGDRSNAPATATSVEDFVKDRIPNLSGVTVTTTWLPNNSQASTVEVRAQYTFAPIIPVLEFTVPISAATRMAVSY